MLTRKLLGRRAFYSSSLLSLNYEQLINKVLVVSEYDNITCDRVGDKQLQGKPGIGKDAPLEADTGIDNRTKVQRPVIGALSDLWGCITKILQITGNAVKRMNKQGAKCTTKKGTRITPSEWLVQMK